MRSPMVPYCWRPETDLYQSSVPPFIPAILVQCKIAESPLQILLESLLASLLQSLLESLLERLVESLIESLVERASH
jgi:hypothetical protein